MDRLENLKNIIMYLMAGYAARLTIYCAQATLSGLHLEDASQKSPRKSR